MAVITGTLAINAAFLQEIKEDNRQLRELIKKVASTCRRTSREGLQTRILADHLNALRDQLALHFTLEDAYGYFEDAIVDAPRLSGEAQRLHSQHDTLFREICDLVDLAEGLLYQERRVVQFASVAAHFFAFQARFERHERGENELILAAFDDDIGVGD